MAKCGVVELRTTEELKKELRRLLKEIVEEEEEEYRGGIYDEALRAITALKDLDDVSRSRKKNATGTIGTGASMPVPKHFVCPLSSAIMRDPVVIASGETYERSYIQEWLSQGNRTCPQTQQVLSTTILTSNLLVRNLIRQWCADNGVDLRSPENPDNEGIIMSSERHAFSALLTDLSSPSPATHKLAVKTLRQLTKRNRSFRALVGEEPAAIPQLLSILSDAGNDNELREDAVTALLNLSIHDANKKPIGESEGVSLLIQSLNVSSTMNTRGNAAAALFTLSALDSNKKKIGELGAIPPLVNLFETGTLAAKKDAASAIFNLCLLNENKIRAVKSGAVDACLAAIENSSSEIMDESLALLALLSSYQEAAEEVADCGGVSVLLRILRNGSSCRNVENAVVVLYAACSTARRKLKEVGDEETMHGTITKLTGGETSRTMRKAAGILERIKRINQAPHHSC